MPRKSKTLFGRGGTKGNIYFTPKRISKKRDNPTFIGIFKPKMGGKPYITRPDYSIQRTLNIRRGLK